MLGSSNRTRMSACPALPSGVARLALATLVAPACSTKGTAGEATASGRAAGEEQSGSLRGGAAAPAPSAAGYEGLLTLDEYKWIAEDYGGVVQVELPSGRVRRFLGGRNGARHPNRGQTVFVEACGEGVGRVAMADERGTRLMALTPCSSEVPNPSCCFATNYFNPSLSYDGTRLAVEAIFFLESDYRHFIQIFDLEQNVLAELDGWDPAWAPDGRLVLGRPDGVYVLDAAMTEVETVGGPQLNGSAFGPRVHPTAERVVFEFNQRIWEIGLDGGNLTEVAAGAARLSSPTYSPDGRAIAFFGQEFQFNAFVAIRTLGEEAIRTLDLKPLLDPVDGVPSGTLTWTAP